RKLAQHLSAGRVQSVAVRLIVEREREIQNFKPEEYWKIIAALRPSSFVSSPLAESPKPKGKPKHSKVTGDEQRTTDNGQKQDELPEGAFLAELLRWKDDKFKAGNKEQADAVLAGLEGQAYVVTKVEQKDRQERPSPPFTTSTLQQQASLRLRYSAKKT